MVGRKITDKTSKGYAVKYAVLMKLSNVERQALLNYNYNCPTFFFGAKKKIPNYRLVFQLRQRTCTRNAIVSYISQKSNIVFKKIQQRVHFIKIGRPKHQNMAKELSEVKANAERQTIDKEITDK